MKKNIVIGVLALAFMNNAFAKLPCGGKKGGIQQCSNNGEFVCNNGTVSASKMICVNNVNWSSPVVKYKMESVKKPKVIRRDI